MSKLFKLQKQHPIEKYFTIKGPYEIQLLIPFDIKEYEQVERNAKLILDVLNNHWFCAGCTCKNE